MKISETKCKCGKCGKTKDINEFYSYNRSRCKVCKRKDAKEFRDMKNPNRTKYMTKEERRNEDEINKNVKDWVLNALFPTGNIPEKFKKRYL
jgi:hypothetical protein